MQDNPLSVFLLQKLGRAPSRAGLRLRSERELARRLGVTLYEIHASLDELVQQGCLVRRHGSGTYVRKIMPLAAPLKGIPPRWRSSLGSVATLFAPSNGRSRRQMPTGKTRRLRLALWSDIHCTTMTNRSILRGMKQRAGELGHALAVHSLVVKKDHPLAPDELARRLGQQMADGCLVVTRWSEQFRKAYEQNGTVRAPVLYFVPGAEPVSCEPLVQMDTEEAIHRAVRLFAAEGFKRIGMIALAAPEHPAEPEQRAYGRAMEDHGLRYRRSAAVSLKQEAVTAAMRYLMGDQGRPEAVYVANDEMLPEIAKCLADLRIVPGRDLGLITLANVGNPLPGGFDWSRLEFDPVLVGRLAVDSLVDAIQTAGYCLWSAALQARWRPGKTHRRFLGDPPNFQESFHEKDVDSIIHPH